MAVRRPSFFASSIAVVALASSACEQASAPVSEAESPLGTVTSANLFSTDAHGISVSYQPSEIDVAGSSATQVASNVLVSVDGVDDPMARVRAVIVDECSQFGQPLFQLVDTCDLKLGPYMTYQADLRTCEQTQTADNVVTEFPSLLVERRSREGGDIRCAQQIAVVVDGTWLTDPISKSHNFNFQLQTR
jgi:hypothetical protein